MSSHSDKNAVHACARNLLQAMAAGAPDVVIRDPEFSRVKPTPTPKRANFVEWENIIQADWEDDEVTRYTETAVMENQMDILAWWKTTNHPTQNLQN